MRPGRLSLSLGEHWLEFLLCNGAHALEQVCRDLPAPWNEDPEILMVISVCRALDGDGAAASELTQRALARTSVLDDVRRRKFDRCRALFEPLPASGRTDCAHPGRRRPVDVPTRQRRAVPPPRQACSCWPRLSSGCTASGTRRQYCSNRPQARPTKWGMMEVGSKAELALAFAAGGDLETAEDMATQALERADGLGGVRRIRWRRPGWHAESRCYWRDELKGARAHLAKAQRLGSKLFPARPAQRLSTGCWLIAPLAIKPILPSPARHWSPSTTRALRSVMGRLSTPSPGQRSRKPRATWTAR